MSNARIEVIRAATLSMAGAFPLFGPGFLADAHASDTWARAPLRAHLAFLVPVQNGTAFEAGQLQGAEFAKAAPLAGMTGPRLVTAKEDLWLRRAAVRSGKLIARGKLVTSQA